MGESGSRAFMRVIRGWSCGEVRAGALAAEPVVVSGGHRKGVGRN